MAKPTANLPVQESGGQKFVTKTGRDGELQSIIDALWQHAIDVAGELNTYESTSAGLASEDPFFRVPSSQVGGLFDYYQNVLGTAIYLGSSSSLQQALDTMDAANAYLVEAQAAAALAPVIEAAADSAFTNANVYPDTTAGLAATSDGEQFTVVTNGEAIRYENDTGSPVEVARYPTTEIVDGAQINRRIQQAPMSKFEVPALDGPFRADMLTAADDGSVTWSVNAAGEIEITASSQDTDARYWWNGFERISGDPVVVELEATADYANPATAVRFMICIGTPGDANSAYQYILTNTGFLSLQINDVSSWSYDMTSLNMASTTGQRIKLKLAVDANGDGYLYAQTPSGTACAPVSGVPSGKIFVGWRSTATGEVHFLKAEKTDIVSKALSGSDVQFLRNAKNILPGDWSQGEGGFPNGSAESDIWKLNNAGTVNVVDLGDYYGLEFASSNSIRSYVDIEAGANSHLAYHLKVHQVPVGNFNAFCRFIVYQLDGGGGTLSQVIVDLQSVELGQSIQGVVALNPSAVRLLYYVENSINGAQKLTVSLPSLAFSKVPGFYPWAPTSLAEADSRITTLENEIGSVADPILERFFLLPDSSASRNPKGFTSTGLDRITRGKWAGCWIVADDGRLLEGDASPFNPQVHIITPDWRTILQTFAMPYSGQSLQGVAVDTSGAEDTFWVATLGDLKLRHFNLYGGSAGTEISGDVFAWGYSDMPNGLAYDPVNDALWVTPFTETTMRLISCNPAASPRLLDTKTLAQSADQLHYDSANELLYYTRGDNGTNGSVRVYRLGTDVDQMVYDSLPRAQAIEGLYIDRPASRLTLMVDGGFHGGASPQLNIAIEYKVPLIS